MGQQPSNKLTNVIVCFGSEVTMLIDCFRVLILKLYLMNSIFWGVTKISLYIYVPHVRDLKLSARTLRLAQ